MAIKVSVPSYFNSPNTNSLSIDQENRVDNLLILGFQGTDQDRTLVYLIFPELIGNQTTGLYEYYANLPISKNSGDKYSLVVLANAEDMIKSKLGLPACLWYTGWSFWSRTMTTSPGSRPGS